MIQYFEAAMARESFEERPLKVRLARSDFKSVFSEVEVIQHVFVEFHAAWGAMARKDYGVGKRAMFLDSRPPTGEMALP